MKTKRICYVKDRLATIMSENGYRQADLIEICRPIAQKYGTKIEKCAMHNYVTGKYEPNAKKLTILALALNVSETWLMGLDVPRERTKRQSIDDDIKDMFDKYKKLTPKSQNLVRELIETLSKTEQK